MTDTLPVDPAILAAAASVHIPADAVLYGPAELIWAQPGRPDYAWRCGACAWTASLYRTEPGCRRSAEKHAGGHEGVTVRHIADELVSGAQ